MSTFFFKKVARPAYHMFINCHKIKTVYKQYVD